MYLTLIKYIAPVVIVVGIISTAYFKGVQNERERWEAKAYQATIQSHEAASKFTAGVLTAHKETEDDAQAKIDQLQNELVAATVAANSLREQSRAFAKRAADSSRAAANCKATEAALGVLADLYAESDRLAGIYARSADENRIAGEACVKAYNDIKNNFGDIRPTHQNIMPARN